jgi:hypothetical protein
MRTQGASSKAGPPKNEDSVQNAHCALIARNPYSAVPQFRIASSVTGIGGEVMRCSRLIEISPRATEN